MLVINSVIIVRQAFTLPCRFERPVRVGPIRSHSGSVTPCPTPIKLSTRPMHYWVNVIFRSDGWPSFQSQRFNAEHEAIACAGARSAAAGSARRGRCMLGRQTQDHLRMERGGQKSNSPGGRRGSTGRARGVRGLGA
jgi:hypothetical protein